MTTVTNKNIFGIKTVWTIGAKKGFFRNQPMNILLFWHTGNIESKHLIDRVINSFLSDF